VVQELRLLKYPLEKKNCYMKRREPQEARKC
jgi:hypothetical protein